MSLGLAYWILMLIWLCFGCWSNWPIAGNARPFGGTLMLFTLLVLIGWKVFDAPIHN